MYNTLNTPSAHPSYSHYYLLSPSTLFFLHILLFFAHLIVLHFLFHCTFDSYFSFFTIYMLLCCVTLYNFYFYYFALSTERTWFDYISLLIIPCITIMWQIKKPWTLNLELNMQSWIWLIITQFGCMKKMILQFLKFQVKAYNLWKLWRVNWPKFRHVTFEF